ncbi:unnamed protein product [Prorocentrum cordatum]|uniref:ER membrane protein complex subunit 1 n=1 Tax=Prorocentrum cordatum TaxID=2364126 RepID=A0ABN9UM82_9DINO|nr:unnamed protein product [Polarella glacialis]
MGIAAATPPARGFSPDIAKALLNGLPPASEVATGAETAEAASTGDFLVTKVAIPLEQRADFVKFLPLRNPRTQSPTPTSGQQTPSTLLMAVQVDGTMRLFTPEGEPTLTFSTEHSEDVVLVAVSPLHDEYLVASADAGGLVRVHKVTVRSRRLSKEEKGARKRLYDDQLSQYLGLQVNVTVQFTKQIRVWTKRELGGRQAPNLTAMALASVQGTKYFVVGDSDGRISAFTRNGTLHARMRPTKAPVETLHVHLGNLLWMASGSWGFVDLDARETRRMDCPFFTGNATAVAVDTHTNSKVVVADDGGGVWVYSHKNKRECKLEHRFPLGAVRDPVDLASVRGFALALERGTEAGGASGGRSAVVALNMSHVGKRRSDPARAAQAVVWRRPGPRVRAWAVHRRYQMGDLMALLSEDGSEIEVVEVLMQVYQPPPTDDISSFKLPLFAVAICLVMGFQYVKQKGAFDPGLMDGDGGDAPASE